MTRLRPSATAAALIVALAAWLPAGPAAAETWATCTGFITSVPTVITTQGTWCFDRDLSTGAASGVAIAINTNNVTIDCNGYKLGNLAAGLSTTAIGIESDGRKNVTLRGCHVRGFATGIHLTGGVEAPITSSGHVVEDVLVEGSTYQGIVVKGRNSLIRRSRVIDIGLNPALQSATGIAAVGTVDVLDNAVEGVETAVGSAGFAMGIYAEALDGVAIVRNRVRGFVPTSGFAWGIYYVGDDSSLGSIRHNTIHREATNSIWINCTPGFRGVSSDNAFVGWSSGSSNCYSFGDIEGF